jgi:hypothetical protein
MPPQKRMTEVESAALARFGFLLHLPGVGIGQDGYHFFGPVGASSLVAA